MLAYGEGVDAVDDGKPAPICECCECPIVDLPGMEWDPEPSSHFFPDPAETPEGFVDFRNALPASAPQGFWANQSAKFQKLAEAWNENPARVASLVAVSLVLMLGMRGASLSAEGSTTSGLSGATLYTGDRVADQIL